MINMLTLDCYLKLAKIVEWNDLPAEVIFPELQLVLDDRLEHYWNNVNYYAPLCANFYDYIEIFMKPQRFYEYLCDIHEESRNANKKQVYAFRSEIKFSMLNGCTFVEALYEWDLI